MALTLTDFTSPAEIRAILGVSSKELKDETLALSVYARELSFDLYDISPDLEATDLALPPSGKTTAQQRFYDATQLFSAYATCQRLLTSLPLFAPKSLTDGRAQFDRQIDPLQDVREGVDASFQLAQKRLRETFEALTSTPVTAAPTVFRTIMGSTGIAVDPVTGA